MIVSKESCFVSHRRAADAMLRALACSTRGKSGKHRSAMVMTVLAMLLEVPVWLPTFSGRDVVFVMPSCSEESWYEFLQPVVRSYSIRCRSVREVRRAEMREASGEAPPVEGGSTADEEDDEDDDDDDDEAEAKDVSMGIGDAAQAHDLEDDPYLVVPPSRRRRRQQEAQAGPSFWSSSLD